MVDVITFGEAMIRLSPVGHERIEQANNLDMKIGGSEANVAVDLSRLGIKTGFLTKLTDNPLGRKVENELQRWNVDTSKIIWTPNFRVGTYYVEFGADPRPSNVIYDRKYTAISEIEMDELDLSYIKKCKIFHTSGISVALSNKSHDAVKRFLEFARHDNKITSFDINYRSKLWASDEASSKLNKILPNVDILFSSESDIDLLFPSSKELREKCKDLIERFSFKIIALTRGPNPPYVLDMEGNEIHGVGHQPKLIDRIGAGDAFDAGFLYGYLNGDIDKAMKYAEAMAALKFSIPGDFAIVYKDEVENFIDKGSKYIKR